MREIRLQTGGGRQATTCMALNLAPYWLSTVEVSRVRPELHDKLTVYRRWVIERVFEAFQRETGIGQATATAPDPRDDETLSLAHIRDMGLVIAAFAEQQIAFAAQQQAPDRHIDIREEGQGQLSASRPRGRRGRRPRAQRQGLGAAHRAGHRAHRGAGGRGKRSGQGGGRGPDRAGHGGGGRAARLVGVYLSYALQAV